VGRPRRGGCLSSSEPSVTEARVAHAALNAVCGCFHITLLMASGRPHRRYTRGSKNSAERPHSKANEAPQHVAEPAEEVVRALSVHRRKIGHGCIVMTTLCLAQHRRAAGFLVLIQLGEMPEE
jgi:hypothetical protein